MRYDQIWGLQVNYENLWVPWYGRTIRCTVWFGFVHGRKCFFIEPHSHQHFFERGAYYGFPDEAQRFAFFSRAALEFMRKAGKRPDIIHCHDWQTALVPVLLFEIYAGAGHGRPARLPHDPQLPAPGRRRPEPAVGDRARPAGVLLRARPDAATSWTPRRSTSPRARCSTPTSSPPSRRTTRGKRGTPTRAAASATRCTCSSASSAASSTASTTRCGTRRSTR